MDGLIKLCTMLLLFTICHFSGRRSTAAASKRQSPPVVQPTGQISINKVPCLTYGTEKIPCPEHTTEDNDVMGNFMKTCHDKEARGNTYGITCIFFPMEYDTVGKKYVSCHHQKNLKYPCMYGFSLRPTRQQRRGKTNDAFIHVEFFGKIPPFPKNGGANHTGFDVAEWISMGISRDAVMGDDLAIYCHPYMDRKVFPPENSTEDGVRYPQEIGVAINKYFTMGDGKQAYDAERKKFSGRYGTVKNGEVRYIEMAGSGRTPMWGVLHCMADISTYILMKSKHELFTGIELDMERQKKATIFMAVGHCLQEECLGDHKDNTPELSAIAERTTPIAYHKSTWIHYEPVTLFQAFDNYNGASTREGQFILVAGIATLTLITVHSI